jgi:hypothetical protein
LLSADDGSYELAEESERSWHNSLVSFKEQVWPIFERHGFAIGEAFIIWELNKIHNAIGDLTDALRVED